LLFYTTISPTRFGSYRAIITEDNFTGTMKSSKSNSSSPGFTTLYTFWPSQQLYSFIVYR